MASAPLCVNQGGYASVIHLADVPQFEMENLLSEAGVAALECWQARCGEILTVVDPEESAYRARLSSYSNGTASCVPFEKLPAPVESLVKIEIYHSLPEKERFELVVQKLTEIGAVRIAPVESFHSATMAERDAGQKKSHRWPEVVRKAARQCRRAMLPELMAAQSFVEALENSAAAELKLMLYEGDAPWTIRESIGSLQPQSVAVLVGPEGGYAEQEVEQARTAGFLPVSLGPRILRTETAAIVAATLIQGYLGDFG